MSRPRQITVEEVRNPEVVDCSDCVMPNVKEIIMTRLSIQSSQLDRKVLGCIVNNPYDDVEQLPMLKQVKVFV